ncbi:Translocation protein sec66 [Fonsecaea pedrosoi]|nr:Translocation protein sec66 [Fonsecaea pedrosoi]
MKFLTFSLLIPIAYLSILIGSMATFSHLYRQRQVKKKLRLAPYFPPHTTRNIYLSLLHLQDDGSTKVPDSVLRAALLARACDDIRRIMEVRMRKPALAALLQRGVVGDEIFQRLQRAEQELELELKDVVAEANALSGSGGGPGGSPGTWGQTIFQSANEMVQNQMLREKLDAIKKTLPEEKERWEKQRETARRELLGGDDPSGTTNAGGKPSTTSTTSTTSPTPVPAPAPASASPPATPAEKTVLKPATASSDEDGVIVETPAAEIPTTTGKQKKKKGKK